MRGWLRISHWLSHRRTDSSTTEPRPTAGPQPIFARARPEKIKIIEKYTYQKTVSLNTEIKPVDEPTGRIEVVMPYDGEKFFSRDAIADVRSRLAARGESLGQGQTVALIGHLVLRKLRGSAPLDRQPTDDQFEVVPLRVPIHSDLLGSVDDLATDQREARLRVEYSPRLSDDLPIPVDIDVLLTDSDSIQISELDEIRTLNQELAGALVREASFSSELRLFMRVKLLVPRRSKIPEPRAEIRRVSITWPTITSLTRTSLRLTLGGTEADLHHNPVDRSLEWLAVPLVNDEQQGSGPAPDNSEAEAADRDEPAEPTEPTEPAEPGEPGEPGDKDTEDGAQDGSAARESAHKAWLRDLADPNRPRWRRPRWLSANGKKPSVGKSHDEQPDHDVRGNDDEEEPSEEELDVRSRRKRSRSRTKTKWPVIRYGGSGVNGCVSTSNNLASCSTTSG